MGKFPGGLVVKDLVLCCHCCGWGHCHSADLIPLLGTSPLQASPKTENKYSNSSLLKNQTCFELLLHFSAPRKQQNTSEPTACLPFSLALTAGTLMLTTSQEQFLSVSLVTHPSFIQWSLLSSHLTWPLTNYLF